MTLTPRTGFMLCVAVAVASAALLASCFAAMAQTTETAAAAQAIAVVGGGGGGGGSRERFTGVATTPDAIAPSSSTAIGGRSCMVPATSDSVSVIFVSYGGARWELDEGCEARSDAEAYLAFAEARMRMFNDEGGALRNLMLGEKRLTSTREAFVAAWPAISVTWEELWTP